MEKKVFQGKLIPFIKENLDSDSGEPSKKFRLSAQNLFLTYSQTSLTKEDAIEQLKGILPDKIKEYIVCQENHEESGLHLHVYLNK